MLGMLGFAIACEVGFRFLPVSTSTQTGYYIDSAILTYPPRHRWQVATGWDLRNAQTLASNNLGFVANRDFVPAPTAVALIGDSYVEASMLTAGDRPDVQLERTTSPARLVYAMGGPGSALLDYAERIRFAYQRLQVRDFVVLMESGDVRQSICGSGNVHSACLRANSFLPQTETQPPPSALKRVVRNSALAQYLFSQLKLDRGRLARQVFALATPETGAASAAVARATDQGANLGNMGQGADLKTVAAVAAEFFARVAPFVRDGRLVIVVDGRRGGPSAKPDARDLERAEFISLARAAGARVVDTEMHYAAHAARSKRSLDVGPADGHLNGLGVQIVMTAAGQALR